MNPDNRCRLWANSAAVLLVTVVALLQVGCSDNQGASIVYKNHCASCHGSKGEGLRALYPSLKGSDYLDQKLERLPCLITGGVQGKIRMPGFSHLSVPEITELVTYLNNSWGTTSKVVSEQMVATWLKDCP